MHPEEDRWPPTCGTGWATSRPTHRPARRPPTSGSAAYDVAGSPVRGAAAMVVALVALLGARVAGPGSRLDTRVEPVAPQGAPHLPDRFYTPEPVAPAFDGPPGPLVGLSWPCTEDAAAHRGRARRGHRVATGQYGFLDLPGRDRAPAPLRRWVPDRSDGGVLDTRHASGRATPTLQRVRPSPASRSTTPARAATRGAGSSTVHGLAPQALRCGATTGPWLSAYGQAFGTATAA